MITLRLQLLLIVGAVICLVIFLNMVRRYKMELKYTMLWLILVLIVLVLSVFPGSFVFISNAMGIDLAVNALFLLAIFCCYLIIFSMTIALSRSSTRMRQLIQEIGLLKHELKQIKDQLGHEEKDGTHK